jgi:hypothetical protein
VERDYLFNSNLSAIHERQAHLDKSQTMHCHSHYISIFSLKHFNLIAWKLQASETRSEDPEKEEWAEGLSCGTFRTWLQKVCLLGESVVPTVH